VNFSRSAAEKDRIESVSNKAKRYGYLPSDFENVHTLVESMEEKLFNSVWYRVTGHFAYAYATENC